jgi:hypothetical protein
MFFDRLDERNAVVKSVPHFDNFTKWTFFSVNTCDRDLQRMVDFTTSAAQVEVFLISRVENRYVFFLSPPYCFVIHIEESMHTLTWFMLFSC